MSWFEVDKGGLRQLQEGKDKSIIPRELIQNAWDEEGVTDVHVVFIPHDGSPFVTIRVTDDAPEGFYDLRHAYTLFAETRKRPDPEKRGRFNLGEKQVLAMCRKASISTTTGTIFFNEDGTRTKGRATRKVGSEFSGEFRMTRAEVKECMRVVKTFLPPSHITTRICDDKEGFELSARVPIENITCTLQTEHQNGEGQWKRTQRKTEVELHEVRDGERAMLYELGLPVVELEGGDPWHLNVCQRVPLNSDRDNVSPAFLRDLRAEVLNARASKLTRDEAAESWVSEAIEDERIESDAVRATIKKRFGEKVVVADPSDRKSVEVAITQGYTIVPPGSMSKAAWSNVREANAVPSSSAMFGTLTVGSERVPDDKVTDDMRHFAHLAVRIAGRCHIRSSGIMVEFINSRASTAADYCGGVMRVNVQKLGYQWFAGWNIEEHISLIVHEICHEFGGHLDDGYLRALCHCAAVLFGVNPYNLVGDGYKAACFSEHGERP